MRNAISSPRQRRASALAGSPVFWCALMALLFGGPLVRAMLRRAPPPPPVLGTFPEVPQARGRLFVSDLVCASCGAEGAAAAEAMRVLQHRSRNLGDAMLLVSFAPGAGGEELLALRRRAGARWTVLDAAPAAVVAQFSGGTRLVLVDAALHVRGRYQATDPAALDAVLQDAALILNSR
jgi:hypothetical protein